MAYKFSQQQIIGLNHHYSRIAEGSFDEDSIRLLLIHLREFLQNPDNKDARGRVNAILLKELGDGIAHTVRTEGKIRSRVIEIVQQLARRDRIPDKAWPPFVLYDLDEIVEALKRLLVDTNALYSPRDINDIFRQQCEDIKICLVSMLHGQIFDVRYDGIADDFHFLKGNAEDRIFVRTELDLGHAGTIRELRLNVWIPRDIGGKYGQCILRHELSDPTKIDNSAYNRTASSEGYCEAVKALRHNGRLVVSPIRTGVSAVEIYKIFRAVSYDTQPISKRIALTTPAGS